MVHVGGGLNSGICRVCYNTALLSWVAKQPAVLRSVTLSDIRQLV